VSVGGEKKKKGTSRWGKKDSSKPARNKKLGEPYLSLRGGTSTGEKKGGRMEKGRGASNRNRKESALGN